LPERCQLNFTQGDAWFSPARRQRQNHLRNQFHREFVYHPFQVHKRCQNFIGTNDEPLSVAMRVNNPDRSPLCIVATFGLPKASAACQGMDCEPELGYLLWDFSCAVLLHSSAAKVWRRWRVWRK